MLTCLKREKLNRSVKSREESGRETSLLTVTNIRVKVIPRRKRKMTFTTLKKMTMKKAM